MKKNRTVTITIVIIVVLLIGGLAGYAIANIPGLSPTSSSSSGDINSFKECADAGNPIQQTFPETCTIPGGQTFTNN